MYAENLQTQEIYNMKKIIKWIRAKLNIRSVVRRCGRVFSISWFYKSWWDYLLQKPLTIRKFICRVFAHDCGVWWYNVGGTEPDIRCNTMSGIEIIFRAVIYLTVTPGWRVIRVHARD